MVCESIIHEKRGYPLFIGYLYYKKQRKKKHKYLPLTLQLQIKKLSITINTTLEYNTVQSHSMHMNESIHVEWQ